jgi:hypothetical protein
MKQWIRSASLFAAITCACAVTAQVRTGDLAYELKGETPGTTTLKQFKKKHIHPDCTSHTPHQTTCRVYEGAERAGILAAIMLSTSELKRPYLVVRGLAMYPSCPSRFPR